MSDCSGKFGQDPSPGSLCSPPPRGEGWRKSEEALRYVGCGCKSGRGVFGEGTAMKHFAVVSNVWDWTPAKWLAWHREKAETIESIHDVLKNELAAGVLPSSRFGARPGTP
ncbi:MAG: hypothetical protein ACRD18_09295 [Terriglobia bacterium]